MLVPQRACVSLLWGFHPRAVTLSCAGGAVCVRCRSSFLDLARSLVAILEADGPVHVPLTEAILHVFSVKYTREEYKDVVSLGVYQALFSCLSRLNASAPTAASAGRGSASAAAVAVGGSDVSLQTAVWALLDYLASTWLEFNRSSNQRAGVRGASSDGGLGPVFTILLAQLQDVSRQVLLDRCGDGSFSLNAADGDRRFGGVVFPSAARRGADGGASAGAQSAMRSKVATAATFGIAHAADATLPAGAGTAAGGAGGDADVVGGDATDVGTSFADAFLVKLLSVTLKAMSLPAGKAAMLAALRSSGGAGGGGGGDGDVITMANGSKTVPVRSPLMALLVLVRWGSPRATIVASRVLSLVLAGDLEASAMQLVDDAAASLLQLSPWGVSAPGRNLAMFLLQTVGDGLSLPFVASIAADARALRDSASLSALQQAMQEALTLSRRSADGVHPWSTVRTAAVELFASNAAVRAAMRDVLANSLMVSVARRCHRGLLCRLHCCAACLTDRLPCPV